MRHCYISVRGQLRAASPVDQRANIFGVQPSRGDVFMVEDTPDAAELLAILVEREVPIVFASGGDDETSVARAMEAGADDYVPSTYRLRTVAEGVAASPGSAR